MKLRIDRCTLLIIPETDHDIAFLEDTMGLREEGDIIKFERLDDVTDNWIKFRIESFVPLEEDVGLKLKNPPRPIKASRAIANNFQDSAGSWDPPKESTQIINDAEEVTKN